MDIDAILKRPPALVDELAHNNAPGSRYPKRCLDVLELLASGIDVYTTPKIQHVESLNDVVAQITRIRELETVPDSVIDRADDSREQFQPAASFIGSLSLQQWINDALIAVFLPLVWVEIKCEMLDDQLCAPVFSLTYLCLA